MDNVNIIATAESWIEGEAIRQLENTARLPGMVNITGLPDLHPGRRTPIGAVFESKDMIYPHLVGNDIGCGVNKGEWRKVLPPSATHPNYPPKWVTFACQLTLDGLETGISPRKTTGR